MKDEVTRDWRRHLNELHDLNSSRNIRVFKSRTMRWAGHVARVGVRRGSYRVLVRKTGWKRQHGPRRRWEDNIKMDLYALEWECGTELSWLMVGKSGRLLWTRWRKIGFYKVVGISYLPEKTTGFSRRTLLHGDGILQGKISLFVINIFRVIHKSTLVFTLWKNFVEHVTVSIIRNLIITIIIFINCKWVVTRWQWLFYMYTKYEIGY